jgi:hypothetical protein
MDGAGNDPEALNCPNFREHPPLGGVTPYPYWYGPGGRWLIGLGYMGGYDTAGWSGTVYDTPKSLKDEPDKAVVVDKIYSGTPWTGGSHTAFGFNFVLGLLTNPSAVGIEGGTVARLDGSARFTRLYEMTGYSALGNNLSQFYFKGEE